MSKSTTALHAGVSRGPSANAWSVPLTAPLLVAHQGKLVAFARAAGVDAAPAPTERLYFKVFEPAQAINADDARAWHGWFAFDFPEAPPAEPLGTKASAEEPLPELRLAGMDLLTVTSAAKAVTAADAPFQIVSDETHLYCFRASTSGTLLLNRLMLAGADGTYSLEPTWEVRFARSRLRDVPDSDTDNQAYTDPTGKPFIEPTIELSAIAGAASGAFAVARVPVGSDGSAAWYVATTSDAGVTLRVVDQSSQSVVDFTEARTYTPLAPRLRGPAAAEGLAPIGGRAPALAFYTEHDPGTSDSGEDVDVQRCGRLMLAFAVKVGWAGPDGAPGVATAIYDFTLDRRGRIPDLAPDQQLLVLADGELKDGAFLPADAPSFPTATTLASTVQAVDGLEVDSMLLGQVRPSTDLALRFGEDGRLHLYYGGTRASAAERLAVGFNALTPGTGQAMVARYDPNVSRVQVKIPWTPSQPGPQKPGFVHFVAAQSGSIMNGARVNVTAAGSGEPDLCDVAIAYPAATGLPAETWTNVPREVAALAEVLNGGASGDSTDPDVLAGTQQFFDVAERLWMARIPAVAVAKPAADGDEAEAHPPALTFVSTRTEIRLTDIKVGAGSAADTKKVVLTFGSDIGGTITQVWDKLPREVAPAYAGIFSGDATKATYEYDGGPGTTPVFALATDAYGIPAPLLLWCTDPQKYAALAGLTITVELDRHGAVSLRFTFAAATEFTVTPEDATVAAVAKALQGNDKVKEHALAVSVEGVAGSLLVGNAANTADLRDGAALFDVIVPPAAIGNRELAPAASGATAFRTSHRFEQPKGLPELDRTRLIGFAVSFDQPEVGTAYVELAGTDSGAVTTVNRRLAGRADETAAQGGSWQRVLPQNAAVLRGSDAMVVTDPTSHALRPRTAWTLETWFAPRGKDNQYLVTYHAEDPRVPRSAPQLDYRLMVIRHNAVRFPLAGQYTKPASFVAKRGGATTFLNESSFTYELWIKPGMEVGPGPSGAILTVGDPAEAYRGTPIFRIGLEHDRHVTVYAVSYNGAVATLRSAGAIDPSPNGAPDWHHIAVTARNNGDYTWTFELYVDATPDTTMTSGLTTSTLSGESAALWIGGIKDYSFCGNVAQLRYWGAVRTPAQIRRNAAPALTTSDPGLLGYWPLDDESQDVKRNRAAATQGQGWDAHHDTLPLPSDRAPQPVEVVADSPFVDVAASVGGLPPVLAKCGMRSGAWNHLALRFEAGGALDLNSDARRALDERDWMRVPGEDFDISGAFAIDAWVRIPKAMPGDGTILSHWAWRDTTQQSFKLEVTAAGELRLTVCAAASEQPVMTLQSAGAHLNDGRLRHVAAVVHSKRGTSDTQGKITARGTFTLTLYVDGDAPGDPPRPVAESTIQAPGVAVEFRNSGVELLAGRGNAAPEGVSQPVSELALLRGVLGPLRFWRVQPSLESLFPERYASRAGFGPPAGLVAAWDFREHEGTKAVDVVGGHDGQLTSSGLWTGLPQTSRLTILANGDEVTDLVPFPDARVAPKQFAIGRRVGDEAGGFVGEVSRLELWGEARSTEEIADQRFVPRVGDEDGLLACWDFSDPVNPGKDITGTGSDVVVAPERIHASSVPIADGGSFVRSAYGGVLTAMTRSTPGRVAVGSYVDVQHGGTVRQRAVLKRQHLFDPALALPGPVQIGLLDYVYMGQVQTRPTLVGYIEGAPPVPSENLARPFWTDPTSSDFTTYDGVSSVALVQQNARSITYSSSTVTAGELSIGAAAGFALDAEVDIQVPFVANIQQFVMSGQVQVVVTHDSKWGREDGEDLSASWTAERRDVMAAGGDWVLDDELVGRRYVPDNLGYALVESLTADLYAAVCRTTRAAVSMIVQPNLAIPPDRNIVIFPLKADYTKAGTLDGKVGLSNDPDYRDADVKRGSYFRPQEAYALAAGIDQDNARSQAYAAQFDWEARGKGGRGGLSGVAVRSAASTGIVNRYAWSADGGLHVEQQGYASAASRSHAGFYEMTTGAGIHADARNTLIIGLSYSLDVMALASLEIHVGLTDETDDSVALDVETSVESYLPAWSESGFGSGAAPGKVRAYRFMSILLPPSADNASHLAAVVDKRWLDTSSDAAARAMRALAGARNPVWRVLHRVTYVERVPPPTGSRPVVVTPGPAREPVNLEGSVELLRLIHGQLVKGALVTPAAVGTAVAAVINPIALPDGTYPPCVLEQRVAWWHAFLVAARKDSSSPAGRLLARLTVDVVGYVVDGYQTGVIQRLLATAAEGEDRLGSEGG